MAEDALRADQSAVGAINRPLRLTWCSLCGCGRPGVRYVVAEDLVLVMWLHGKAVDCFAVTYVIAGVCL